MAQTNKSHSILTSARAGILIRDPEEQYLAWLLTAMVPYRDAPQPIPEPGKKLPPPVAANIAREGFKATNKVSEVVIASIRNHQEITSMVASLAERKRYPNRPLEGEDPTARDVLGMAIRRWGATWRSQAIFALLVNVADDPEAAKCGYPLINDTKGRVLTPHSATIGLRGIP